MSPQTAKFMENQSAPLTASGPQTTAENTAASVVSFKFWIWLNDLSWQKYFDQIHIDTEKENRKHFQCILQWFYMKSNLYVIVLVKALWKEIICMFIEKSPLIW